MNEITPIAIKKVSPSETLKSIPIGETRIIRNRAIKENIVRSTASRLGKSGYVFSIKSDVDCVVVTRTE